MGIGDAYARIPRLYATLEQSENVVAVGASRLLVEPRIPRLAVGMSA